MGTTYHYANLTKQEWFSTDALGGSAKLRGLGLNLTARAFDLLFIAGLAPATVTDPVRPGRWVGDVVVIIGDTDENWLRYNDEFADLTADVILLVHTCDGFDRIASAAEEYDALFMQVCHIVSTGQAPELESQMKQRFGTSLRQRYKELCQNNRWFKPKDVARPGEK
ncbi:hypothetical protein [Limnoglobus roseus]|uniref:Uncharacterized protein n=1 Tax=Limnoglobus roseus TaxID=2598579 RepID=A0A5C1A7N9_9BACT|nr:hypothetical protein [Limnoglobus roseus]QEL14243.1 hypothetical protein PX52LOC_01113 [Limnoglobus roseus]